MAISIVLLSVADAFLTLVLLQAGADEVNPVMALLVYRSVAVFAALKMAMTELRRRFHGVSGPLPLHAPAPVEWVLYGVLIGYVSLIGYEICLLKDSLDAADLVIRPSRRHIPYCAAFG